jgi:O-acetyl-ADP-ribose deacetylase (regulator of RNase III)
MELTAENGIVSIEFPSISAGIYGYPIEQAARVAVSTVRRTSAEGLGMHEVIFCFFSWSDLALD